MQNHKSIQIYQKSLNLFIDRSYSYTHLGIISKRYPQLILNLTQTAISFIAV